jgi:putative inorganic carbon (hco3(-)) transporter
MNHAAPPVVPESVRPGRMDRRRSSEGWLWPLGALAGSVLLGVWITRDPTLLHLDVSLTLRSLAPLAVAAALVAVILRYPGTGLLLLVTAVYLNLSQVLVRDHGFPSLLQILVVPLFLAAVVERVGRDGSSPVSRFRRGHHLLLLLLALHVGAILLSTTVAADRGLADERLIEVSKGFVLVVLVVLLATTRSRIRGVVWTLLGAGVLLGGLAVVQSVTGDFGNDFGGLARIKHAHIHGNVFQPRIAGPLGDPNYFAQILLVLVPIALFLGWRESSRPRRALAFAAGGVILVASVLTYSRGGALALGVVLLLSVLVNGVGPRVLGGGLVLLLAAGYLLPQGFTERLATVSEIVPGQEDEVLQRDSSFEERLLLGGVAWAMFRDRPLLGVGAGNYTVHFDDYVDRVGSTARDYGSADEARYPHNLYLELGAEGGVVALITFIFVMGGALVLLFRARRAFLASGDPYLAGLAAAVAIGLVGYLISSLFLHGHFQRYLWLLVGLGAALYAVSTGPETARVRGPGSNARPLLGARPSCLADSNS